jgi:hypothetical protein
VKLKAAKKPHMKHEELLPSDKGDSLFTGDNDDDDSNDDDNDDGGLEDFDEDTPFGTIRGSSKTKASKGK